MANVYMKIMEAKVRRVMDILFSSLDTNMASFYIRQCMNGVHLFIHQQRIFSFNKLFCVIRTDKEHVA